MVEMLTIDPNVRLLKMLGEDLIKDEKTAIIELIKNSYDADATKVKVFFINFDSDYSLLKNSEIIIVDNGQGMSKDIIKNDWLSPGTANKKKKKKAGEKTSLGRVYQGEKGIGRYSMLKLARTVELYSKPKDDSLWNYAKLDLSNFDKDFTNEVYESNLLSELKIPYMEEKTHAFNELSEYIEKQGTIIRLTNLNGSWNSQKVTDVYNDLARLEPITKIINKWNEDLDINLYFENFDIRFYQDGFETNHRDTFLKELKEFLKINEEKCLISINDGFFNDRNGEFKFNVNGVTHSVNLGDTKLKKLVSFKRSVFKEFDNFTFDNLSCGPFNFEFYFFNFDKNKKTKEHLSKHILSNEEKKLVEKHRIYLYRDSARVYPYGEEDNDWLGIDALRGLSKANQFFSNDQTVGFISISYEHNPQLQDKTNREGLIEEGNSTKQFISLIQIILNYIRTVINLEVDENLKKKKREEQQEQT
ncbi:ATP-binding protein, partial [Bacillus altitudinis]|uniref:ATP-binding protein n=1 Tax=Bacillus altitudinis TaxID=293387 RepID=UPI00227EA433